MQYAYKPKIMIEEVENKPMYLDSVNVDRAFISTQKRNNRRLGARNKFKNRQTWPWVC